MADRRLPRSGRPEGGRGLSAALRQEARADRPAFSTALHERVCAAVAETPRRAVVRGAPRWPWPSGAGLVGGMATVVAAALLMVGAMWWPVTRPRSPAAATVADTDVPGIERFPTPGEIGEGVLAEVRDLAEAAVGVPGFADLAAFDANAFTWADDAGQ